MHSYAALSRHPAVDRQMESIEQLATELAADQSYVRHSHTSKSIILPVPTLEWILQMREGRQGSLTMMIRDNFHDINLLVMSNSIIDLPLSTFYQKNDFAWYQENIDRKRNYSYRGWTDEEVADPRILRVKVKNVGGHEYWSTVRNGDEKDRWADRMTSTEWYGKDWASGELLTEGPVPFTEDTVFYHASHAYAEGIPEHAKPYTGPCAKFILSLDNWSELVRVSKLIVETVKANHALANPFTTVPV